MLVFSWALNSLLVILTVAFFTLFERKIIGLIHLRVGPNKVSFLGLVQPLVDAVKLLRKQHITSTQSNKIIYSLTPLRRLVVSLLFWLLFPQAFITFSITFSILVYLVLGSILVLLALLSGWRSNSKYTFIGSLRSIAQSVSYESVFTTLVILCCVLSKSYRILTISATFRLLMSLIIMPLWAFSLLAETHRAPFDFSESESELVSGYNTEYGRANFAWLFLAEYSALLFGCGIIYFLFIPVPISFLSSPMIAALFILVISYIFTLVRVSYCRFRYDYLISFAWKSLLPTSLMLLTLSYCLV
jgi:NADH-ubiquinone oxidoreductase chain 1